ncbi:MAG: hypothetical protein ABSF09_12775 [Candidatus Bathyarchaeia archaeon]|jgi:hypothetical protein
MYTETQLGTLLLVTATVTALLLLNWIRSLKIAEAASNESKYDNAESITAKALNELAADPPNFRSMIEVLRERVIATANGIGRLFLVETERQRTANYVDAQTFKSIHPSYLWSMKLAIRGKEE